jgi:hypothetical protein
MVKLEYNTLILLGNENKATCIRHSNPGLLMAALSTNQYHIVYNLGARKVVRATHYTKNISIYYREKANETTFPEQNYTKTYSRTHIVPNVQFPAK